MPENGGISLKKASLLDDRLHHTADVASGRTVTGTGIQLNYDVFISSKTGKKSRTGKINGSRGLDSDQTPIWGFEVSVSSYCPDPSQGDETISVTVSNPNGTGGSSTASNPQPSDLPG
ncbi:MAG TPA: hypothetical protein VNC50_17220 [Planctomycetia bacterium]|nr:hypothetical protein [Planctomycetia bacterium]